MATMEQELFDWDGWDGDPECMIFYNAVLKVSVGKYATGTKFDSALIMQSAGNSELLNGGILQLCDYEDTQNGRRVIVKGEYSLHYRIGDVLREAEDGKA